MLLSGKTTCIILNEEMNFIMKIVKSPEKCCFLIKRVSKTIKNEAIKQKGRFLSMLLGPSGTSLSENLLTCKSTTRAGESPNIIKMNLILMVLIQEIIYLK